MSRLFDLIIFDWDGTLSDSAGGIVDAMQAAIADLGLPERDDHEISTLIGLGVWEAMAILFPDHPRDELEPKLLDYRARRGPGRFEQASLFPQVRETLQVFADDGLTLAVATGKGRQGLEVSLDATGLRSYFKATRTVDEAPSKPAPDMLEELLWETDTPPGRALMVYPGTDPVYDDQLDDDPSGKSVDGVLGSWAEFHKATDTVAFNGQYTATVEVRLDGEPDPGTPTQSTAGVPMTLGLQGRRTDVGLWVDFGEATYYSLAGSLNVLRDGTITGTAPPEWDTWNTHSATEYRVEIKAGGDTTYRRITDFIQVEYTYLDTPGSGAESNPALPSGQKITYLVFPRG